MKRSQQFLTAVQILAPGDTLILKTARWVPEETLPVVTGGAADVPGPRRNRSNPHGRPKTEQCRLSLSHTLRIQSARFWLELGEPDSALRELEALPSRAWSHPLVVKARNAALLLAGEMSAVAIHQ